MTLKGSTPPSALVRLSIRGSNIRALHPPDSGLDTLPCDVARARDAHPAQKRVPPDPAPAATAAGAAGDAGATAGAATPRRRARAPAARPTQAPLRNSSGTRSSVPRSARARDARVHPPLPRRAKSLVGRRAPRRDAATARCPGGCTRRGPRGTARRASISGDVVAALRRRSRAPTTSLRRRSRAPEALSAVAMESLIQRRTRRAVAARHGAAAARDRAARRARRAPRRSRWRSRRATRSRLPTAPRNRPRSPPGLVARITIDRFAAPGGAASAESRTCRRRPTVSSPAPADQLAVAATLASVAGSSGASSTASSRGNPARRKSLGGERRTPRRGVEPRRRRRGARLRPWRSLHSIARPTAAVGLESKITASEARRRGRPREPMFALLVAASADVPPNPLRVRRGHGSVIAPATIARGAVERGSAKRLGAGAADGRHGDERARRRRSRGGPARRAAGGREGMASACAGRCTRRRARAASRVGGRAPLRRCARAAATSAPRIASGSSLLRARSATTAATRRARRRRRARVAVDGPRACVA